MPSKTVIDIDGSEAVSKILLDLLNQFPGLTTGNKSILFSTLSGRFGDRILSDFRCGFAEQHGGRYWTRHAGLPISVQCGLPRRPEIEAQRIRIKEFLDALGKWLERQPVTLNGKRHQLSAYPALLAGNRVIKKISRTSPAYLNSAYQDGVEDWLIGLRLDYNNEFDI
ncbi:MAG: hypothetical protein ACLRR6_02065 [Oscillospiraceae bacterium]